MEDSVSPLELEHPSSPVLRPWDSGWIIPTAFWGLQLAHSGPNGLLSVKDATQVLQRVSASASAWVLWLFVSSGEFYTRPGARWAAPHLPHRGGAVSGHPPTSVRGAIVQCLHTVRAHPRAELGLHTWDSYKLQERPRLHGHKVPFCFCTSRG